MNGGLKNILLWDFDPDHQIIRSFLKAKIKHFITTEAHLTQPEAELYTIPSF